MERKLWEKEIFLIYISFFRVLKLILWPISKVIWVIKFGANAKIIVLEFCILVVTLLWAVFFLFGHPNESLYLMTTEDALMHACSQQSIHYVLSNENLIETYWIGSELIFLRHECLCLNVVYFHVGIQKYCVSLVGSTKSDIILHLPLNHLQCSNATCIADLIRTNLVGSWRIISDIG